MNRREGAGCTVGHRRRKQQRDVIAALIENRLPKTVDLCQPLKLAVGCNRARRAVGDARRPD